MSHTPGPWRINEHGAVIDSSGSRIRATGLALATGYVPETDEAHANNRLIAAAPDLLEALERIVRLNDAMPEDHSARLSHGELSQAITAIAKATGEKP